MNKLIDILAAWEGAYIGGLECYSELALTMAATVEQLCADEQNNFYSEPGGHWDGFDTIWDKPIEWQRRLK